MTSSGFNTVLGPNAPTCMNDRGEWNWGILPPSSYHQGGVHIAMADGSVRFASDSIDTGNLTLPEVTGTQNSPYGVWGALGSKMGKETIGEF